MSAARARVAAWALVAVLAATGPARAAYSCTVSANDVAFGPYSVIVSADVDSAADLTVDCSGDDNISVNAVVAINAGSGGSFSPRTMANGVNTLFYNVYTKSNHSIVWGDGSGGTQTQTIKCNLKGPPTSCSASKPMYGRIPAGQSVPAGSYTDMLTATITY